jgi:hypothetical protein
MINIRELDPFRRTSARQHLDSIEPAEMMPALGQDAQLPHEIRSVPDETREMLLASALAVIFSRGA